MRLLSALLLVAACSPHHDPSPDAGPDPHQSKTLPKCPTSASVSTLNADGGMEVLVPGQRLPVVLGFQGLLMVQLAFRAPAPLAQQVDVGAELTTPSGTDILTGFNGWATHPVGPGSETETFPLILNDIPRPQLVRQDATIELWVAQATCRLTADVDVVLALAATGMDAGPISQADAGEADAGGGSSDAGQ